MSNRVGVIYNSPVRVSYRNDARFVLIEFHPDYENNDFRSIQDYQKLHNIEFSQGYWLKDIKQRHKNVTEYYFVDKAVRKAYIEKMNVNLVTRSDMELVIKLSLNIS